MIYEERNITLRLGRLQDYLQYFRDDLRPGLNDAGGRVVRLLGGLIGDPPTQLLQITAYEQLANWHDAQNCFLKERSEYVDREEVRLLRSVASRPKDPVSPKDSRPIYAYRRLFITPEGLPEFVRCSEEGVWPCMEVLGARVLGLWTTVAATEPFEIILATGYKDFAHWEDTRFDRVLPQGIDKELWEHGRALGVLRRQLTLTSSARLMRFIDLDPSGSLPEEVYKLRGLPPT